MKKIKILHISETFAAGVYTYIKDICQFFDHCEGFENYVIYSGRREDTDRDKFQVDFSGETTLIEVPMAREISPLTDIRAVLSLRREIRAIRPDVIHLHSSKAGILGRMAAKTSGNAALYYTPNGYAFLRQDISPAKRKIFKALEWFAGRVIGGTTIACGDTEFEYAKSLGKALLVRNGIDVPAAVALAKPETTSQFTIGTVGRLSHQKNPALFNAIARLLPDFRFVWIGGGELVSEIDAPNIEVVGWIPREEVLRRLNGFDVYLQTSLWEGLPFAIIEAMSLGKPAVVTNVIGNKDAVEHGYNGFLCMEPEDFASRLRELKDNPEQKADMGRKSTERALERFDRNRNFLKLKEIYASRA